MEITDVKTIMICKKYEKPERGPYYPSQFFAFGTIIQVFTDEGIIGLGAARGWVPPSVAMTIEKGIKPLIIGEDPFNVERIWRKIFYSPPCYPDYRGIGFSALSGVEIALWDIIGKSLQVPIYELLGGYHRKKIRVYASKILSKDPEEAAKEALEVAEQGFTAAKIQLGHLPLRKDVERVKAIREAVPELDLVADVNGRWTFSLALQGVKELEKYNLLWLEEPFEHPIINHIEDSRRLVEVSNIPIASGEAIATKYGARDLIVNKAVDIIQHNVIANGIMESKKMCSLAEAFDIPWAPNCGRIGIEVAASLQLAANVPNFIMLEYWKHPGTSETRSGILTEPLEMHKGYIDVPDKPGLGVELNEEELAKFSVKKWTIPITSVYPIEEWKRWYSYRSRFDCLGC